jgi:hypothetical protein
VLKDVIPQAVGENEDYNAGTMDPESTALALVVEKLLGEGVDPADIDLEEIKESDSFTALVEKITEVLEEQGNVTEDPEVLEIVEEVINPPATPTPPGPTTKNITNIVTLTYDLGEPVTAQSITKVTY